MKYLSMFSGIEAASVAWEPLGWTPLAFAEIEKFPASVLKHHYPHVPNLGDVTKVDWDEFARTTGRPDLIVFGSPCQSFSVAGKRLGLDDPRGNLALYALDVVNRLRPSWFLFENVPGLLSSGDGRDFGQFLATVGECGYQCAWRILDAQYVRVDGFGRAVPQRRRRVFVVGHLGDWRRPAAVLFERESLLGNSPPRRQAGERVAGTIDGGAHPGSYNGQDAYNGKLITSHEIAQSLLAKANSSHRADAESYVAHSLRAEGFDASEDLHMGRGVALAPTLRAGGFTDSHADAGVMPVIAYGLRRDADRSGEAATPSPDASGRLRLRDAGFNAYEGPHTVATSLVVRRLTPRECERLQGFPDDYTAIPKAADGPRYKALGNSMAVNCMRWLGRRIQMFEELSNAKVA